MTRQVERNALDCSGVGPALFWGLVGAGFALLAFAAQGGQNWASVLRVGSANPLRHQIEKELGEISVSDPTGHDGQLYYMVARDPFAGAATVDALNAFDSARYRYRRILFPLLAGGFGLFSAKATLAGMIILAILGMGLMAIAIADLAFTLRLRGGTAIVGILNLGALVSVMLLTGDIMAFGLALLGTTLVMRGRLRWGLVALGMSALTKETYLVVALALGVWRWRQGDQRAAALLLGVPMLPLAAWSAWLWYAIPIVSPTPARIGAPLLGIAEGVAEWARPDLAEPVQLTFAAYTACSVALATLTGLLGRNVALRSVVAGWLILAMVTGGAVWNVPTNAARAFSILWPLGVLLTFEMLVRPDKRGVVLSKSR